MIPLAVLRRFPKVLRQAREASVIRASGLFDGKWYLEENPDVAQAGVNPLIHYVRRGAIEGRDPNPFFDSDWYLDQHPDVAKAGVNPLFHYIRRGWIEGRDPSPHFDNNWYLKQNPVVAKKRLNPVKHYMDSGSPADRIRSARPGKNRLATDVTEILSRRWPDLQPLRVYSAPGLSRRVNLVTDSINAGSLYGGVGTAIILSALLANRLGAGLRIITRTEKAEGRNFHHVVRLNGLEWHKNVEFVFARSGDDSTEVDFANDDLFITTSWWTTWSTKHSVPENQIVYLLQEDERMFYPFGDDRLRCSDLLGSPDIRFLINSKLLFGHLVAEGFENIRQNSCCFEPSFPRSYFYPDPHRESGKKNFLFYARPNNVRNLYYRGLEVMSTAIEQGILNPEEWDLHFVGRDLAQVSLPGGFRPRILQNLQWAEYAALVRRMDLGLSLMDTPHPGYPTIDLAACGAVAVTNKFGVKQSLEAYSRNILCRNVSVASLVSGIADGVKLAANEAVRAENYRNSSMLRDWSISFEGVLQSLTEARDLVRS